VIGRLLNVFRVPEIRSRILITIGFLLVYRVGWNIPIPGVDLTVLKGQDREGSASFAAMFELLSGGLLTSCALFSLGIMPYISASIIFSLLAKVVPALEKVAKEGSAGQRKINQWTRLATVPLAFIQAIIVVNTMFDQGERPLLPDGFWISFGAVLAMTAGTIFLMWIGEQITEYGVGNGISLLIMAGIIARVPHNLMALMGGKSGSLVVPVLLVLLFFLIVVVVVYITKGTRKIPVQYAKLTRGRRVYGGQKHFLPIKVNQAGVMPVIFSSALLSFPSMIGQTMGWDWLTKPFQTGSWIYSVLDIALIFFFAFFWTSLMFNPAEMSKNMKEYGSFIPGIRPGKKTAEFLERVMTRITLAGATFLAIIALVPQQLALMVAPTEYQIAAFLGGTSILIVVSVALDLVDKLNSALLQRSYEGFFRGGGGPGGSGGGSLRKR
jgi:preprotein translocase subunit SecY